MTVEKLATDVPGLETITAGGIPKGRATLIAGKSGTCKSILALQILGNLARRGHKGLVIAIEESPDDLKITGDQLGMNFTGLLAEDKIAFADLTRPMEGPMLISGDYDLSGLVHRIEAEVKARNVEVVVLDSSTALFSPRPPEEFIRSHFFQLVYALRRLNVTTIITAEAPGDYGPPLTTLGVEDFVCDLVIVMRNLVDAGRRRRSMEVHKYRRSMHYKGEYPCTITRDGLTIFPLDAGVDAPMTVERYSSGLKGLDELTSGGWLRDSIVLVRGPSGSGKTMLAGMYARAGAIRGERVVYYGFEETRSMLLRNFAAIGMPMEDLVAKGNLRLVCRYPEAISPEDMLVDLRVGLNDFDPSLIVLDSISSIEHSVSAQGFRQFMVGLSSLLRTHGRSALVTQTVAPASESDLGAPYLSTIADAILSLNYSTNEPEMQRTMRVLKMRGSSHVTEQRKLSIIPGGLRLESMPR